MAPPPARVTTVELVDKPIVVESQGTVRPKIEVDLVAQVGGTLVEVAESFAAGGFFGAGDVLVRIDPRDIRIDLAQARRTLAEARRTLAEERGRAREARRQWRELGSEDANELFLRKPQLAAAEAAVEAAEAAVEQARINLERTRISVPFDGRVIEVDANLGQYVAPGATIGRVLATDVMEVRLPLSAREMMLLNLESDARELHPLAVTLKTRVASRQFRWRGKLVRIEPVVDRQTRFYHAVVEVEHAYEMDETHPPLVAGSFVEAEIESNPYEDVVVLPRRSLYETDKVMVLDADNRLRLVPVEVLQIGGETLVARGLEAGRTVVVSPPAFIERGAVYKPVPVGDGGGTE
jgi:RND family efflux transporter MFP subunit